MKKYLNTLYVTTQGAYLAKDGETVQVRVEGKTKLTLPIHTLDSIVCFGQVSCSPFLLGHCAESNVAVSFLTERGRFLATVNGPVSGNVLLRRQQYRGADNPDMAAGVARAALAGKIGNAVSVLARGLRDHGDKIDAETVASAVEHLRKLLPRLNAVTNVDNLRGIEGEAANRYFSVFQQLITANQHVFAFQGRNRRPPLDPVNCLLSFIYTLLCHDVRAALQAVGLDPQVGFLHRDRPGRPSLALDIMEEYRPWFADRLVLKLINRGQVKPGGFATQENGAVRMDDDTRKCVLVAYQERKNEELTHPFLNEKMSIGQTFHVQARLLARHIRGELDAYPPIVWR